MNMTEIAEKMRHTTAAATGLVDRLQKLGFVDRVKANDDRRKVLVCILPRARSSSASSEGCECEHLPQVMLHLTPQEQAMWIAIYTKIFAYVEGQKDNSPKKCTQI